MEQVAFRLGGFAIHWYGILVALGFMAGLWTASRRGLRDGVSGEVIVDLGPWLMLGAIVGARVLHVISYWREEFAERPISEIFMIHHGGLVFYGGLVGASLATIFCARAKGLPLWKLADVFAPSIALGQVFGRIGCFMNGCCYGTASGLPWAIGYPMDHATRGQRVHPTQLYEALLNLALYAGLSWQYRHRKFTGQTFASYLIGYGLLRFGVEFLRGDYDTRYLGGWATPGQLVSLGVLAAGIGFWRRLGGGDRPRPTAAST